MNNDGLRRLKANATPRRRDSEQDAENSFRFCFLLCVHLRVSALHLFLFFA